MTNRARGKLFIDRKVQGALARRILVHWALFFVACTVTILGLQYFFGEPGMSMGQHLEKLWNQYALFVVLIVAMLPSFIYDTIKLSNRFTGPIVRLRRGIKEMADGEEQVTEMNFRGGDFWVELSHEFNRLAKRVRELEEKDQKLNEV
jgi:hypothetical protein